MSPSYYTLPIKRHCASLNCAFSLGTFHNNSKYKLCVNTVSVLLGNLLCTVWVNIGFLVFSGVHSAYRRQSSPGPYWRISFKGIRSEDPGFHSATKKSFRSYECITEYLVPLFVSILRFSDHENKIRDLMAHVNCQTCLKRTPSYSRLVLVAIHKF